MDCNFIMSVKNPKTGKFVDVPCGKCMGCRIARVRDWSVRLLDEASCWQDTCFVTLTYADECLPLTNCGKATLLKSDLQKFFKRLRKRIDGKIRYFACGEYGSQANTHRPHYHFICFGLSPSSLRLIEECWPFGFVKVGSVTPESIKYVCGYVEKKIFYDKADFLKAYGCLVPPFQLMSQGLGYDFYKSHYQDFWIKRRQTIRGVSYSVPRYFIKRDYVLKKAMQLRSMKVKEDRNRKILSAEAEGYSIYDSCVQREADLRARAKLRKGSL